MILLLIQLLLLSGIALAEPNISVSFSPVILQREPALMISVVNLGEEPITNLTISTRAEGLDMQKKAFMSVPWEASNPQLTPQERKTLTYQFRYPDTKDDITVYTDIHSDQGNMSVILTIPAFLISNLSLLSSSKTTLIYPVAGLVVVAVLILRKKK